MVAGDGQEPAGDLVRLPRVRGGVVGVLVGPQEAPQALLEPRPFEEGGEPGDLLKRRQAMSHQHGGEAAKGDDVVRDRGRAQRAHGLFGLVEQGEGVERVRVAHALGPGRDVRPKALGEARHGEDLRLDLPGRGQDGLRPAGDPAGEGVPFGDDAADDLRGSFVRDSASSASCRPSRVSERTASGRSPPRAVTRQPPHAPAEGRGPRALQSAAQAGSSGARSGRRPGPHAEALGRRARPARGCWRDAARSP
jgi:hypothetical protein